MRFSGTQTRSLAVLLAAAFLSIASSAGASTTVGQLSPTSPATESCGVSDYDIFDPTVTSGNGYAVPAGGDVITSWSTVGGPSAGRMLAMKVFRPVSGTTYQVVAHDGPRPIQPGLNTFAVSIPVHPGDVVGINSGNSGSALSACFFTSPSQPYLFFTPGVADGASQSYSPDTNTFRPNVSAVVASKASNEFSFGKLKRNQAKGTATLAVTVPGPGKLTLTGKGVKAQRPLAARASKAVSGAGTVKLRIKAKGKKKAKLIDRGKVKVKVKVSFAPTSEVPVPTSVERKRVKLIVASLTP